MPVAELVENASSEESSSLLRALRQGVTERFDLRSREVVFVIELIGEHRVDGEWGRQEESTDNARRESVREPLRAAFKHLDDVIGQREAPENSGDNQHTIKLELRFERYPHGAKSDEPSAEKTEDEAIGAGEAQDGGNREHHDEWIR